MGFTIAAAQDRAKWKQFVGASNIWSDKGLSQVSHIFEGQEIRK